MTISSQKRGVVALIAGAALPFAFAPFGLYAISFVSLALLFWLWSDSSPRQAALYGFIFGLGQFGVGVSWVYVAIHTFGNAAVPLALFLTMLFVACLAVFHTLAGYVVARLRVAMPNRSQALLLVVLMPLVWNLFEWIRGWLLTGFPWLNLGYSQIDSPLRGWAPVFGVYGLSWLVALISGILVWWWLERSKFGWVNRRAAVAIVMLLATGQALTLIEWTEPTERNLSVALVQGNVEQQTKWSREGLRQRINRYTEATRSLVGKYELIVWPENSITQFYDRLEKGVFNPLAASAGKKGSEIVLGVPVRRDDGRYYTSMVVAGDATRQFHKRHLVPFGEFLPFESLLRGLIEFFNMPMSNFTPGPEAQANLLVAGIPAAVTICYEDLFGEELLSQLPEAELLLNGSNNAWYGDSLAAHQHLEIARMRSLELGRWTLRSTTNGISAIIDPHGVIQKRSPQFEQAVVTGVVKPMQGVTPYILWGNWPVIVLMGLGLMALLYQPVGQRIRQDDSIKI